MELLMSEEKCKYLGENWGDCWRVSGNIFQKCISKNKEKCILLKNEQLHNKIDNLEQQLKACKEELQAYKEDRFCQGGCTIYQFDKIKQLKEENEKLTQQNKQMREALEKIKIAMQNKQNLFRQKNIFGNIYDICIQALKGVE